MFRKFIVFSFAAFILLASCTLTSPSATLKELNTFQSKYMTTFDTLNGTYLPATGKAFSPFLAKGSVSSRATAPISGAQSYTLPLFGNTLTGTLEDYPEPGQSSSWIVTVHNDASHIYLVEVTTTFTATDARQSQEESYYLKDANVDGKWTTADTIVNETGTDDPKYRVKNTLYYRDNSTQVEKIITVKFTGSAYKAWPVDGSLDYPTMFIPQADPAAAYSSVVTYTRTYTDNPNFSFWTGNRVRSLFGVRYYTESLNAAKTQLISSMVVFEKGLTELDTVGGTFTEASSSLFLPSVGKNTTNSLLSQSMLRQEIVYEWNNVTKVPDYTTSARDTRMKSQVVNVSGQGDYYIARINSEAAAITNADGTIWIPTGDATEVLNSSPNSAVDVKSKNTTISSTDLTEISISNNTPSGDLGTLWVSIQEGTAINAINTVDIPGDVSGTGDIKVFNGTQGVTLPTPTPAAAYSFHDKGTIQAWVYINGATNTPGIVHSGIKQDWSDEIWSLQFMGSQNTLAFSLSAQSPYVYDYITSTINLNNKTWYYVVATWDLAANKMNLYINGVARGSGKFKKVRTTSTFPAVSPVVIGSQHYDATQVLSGYYGFNGKINGVMAENRVWTEIELLNFYNQNKAKTAQW